MSVQSPKGSSKLAGKVALVNGGASGIGRAVAVLFAREGAEVAIIYPAAEQSEAEESKREIENHSRRVLLIPGDVTNRAFCEEAVARTVNELGKLDILVNSSAYHQEQKKLEDISDEEWDLTFRTNIYGHFYMARAALPHLKEGAAIINSGSSIGLEGSKDLIDYSATNGAIQAFTKALAQNLIDRRIRVNCVASGPLWSYLHPASIPEVVQRSGMLEEIAQAFVFFASKAESSCISGKVMIILGDETSPGYSGNIH